jgi:hypothetical protein
LCSKQHIHELAEQKETLKSLGVPLVIIGNGSANFGKSFMQNSPFSAEWSDPETSPLKIELYVDTALSAYTAFNLHRGLLATLSPSGLFSMLRAKSKFGLEVGKVEGDSTQQGGTFVLGPGDTIHYSYANNNPGDHAPIEEVIAALKAN